MGKKNYFCIDFFARIALDWWVLSTVLTSMPASLIPTLMLLGVARFNKGPTPRLDGGEVFGSNKKGVHFTKELYVIRLFFAIKGFLLENRNCINDMRNRWEYVEIVIIYSILVCCPSLYFQQGLDFKGFRPGKYRMSLFHLVLLFTCRLSAKINRDMPWLNTFGVDLEYSNVTHPLPFLMWHGAEAHQRQQGLKKHHRLEGAVLYIYT